MENLNEASTLLEDAVAVSAKDEVMTTRTFLFRKAEFRRASDNVVTYVVDGMVMKLEQIGSNTLVYLAFASQPNGFYARVTSYTLVFNFDFIQYINGSEVVLKTISFSNFRLECAPRQFSLSATVEGFFFHDTDIIRRKGLTWYFDPCRRA